MKKNLICVLLALVLVLGLMVVTAPNANAAEAHTHCICVGADEGALPEDHVCDEAIVWEDIASASITDGGHYYLSKDTAKALTVKDITISICLNGKSLYAGKPLTITGGTVNLCDCNSTTNRLYSNRGTNANGVVVEVKNTTDNRGHFNLYSGRISGAAGTGKSGNRLVQVNGSYFNMYGGTLINGRTGDVTTDPYTGYGAAIYVRNANASKIGTVEMNGGTITGGIASLSGGNIYMDGGKFTMNGGTITGGIASAEGGNVYVAKASNGTGTFTQNGGTITNGSASTDGGNIYVNSSILEMVGGTITGGSAVNGGNIATNGNGSGVTLTLSGGTIENGTATGNGGNIYIDDGGKDATNAVHVTNSTVTGGKAQFGGNIYTKDELYIETGAIISDGFATKAGGNIRVDGTGSKLEMSAGTISGGNAGETGGNVNSLNCTNVIISGGTISNGTAGQGGNLYIVHSTLVKTRKLNISNATITGGNATAGNGGNLYISRVGETTLTDVTMTDGVATNSGSNVYVQLSHEVTINGGTYSVAAGNRNYTYDSEKHTKYAQEEIETYGLNDAGTRITGNGGNICISSCESITTDIKDDEGNVTGSEITEGSAAITGATIIGGNAVNGGALYVGNANVTLDGITAKSCGGGSGRALHVAKNGEATVKDSTLINWGTVGTTIVNQGTLKLVGTVNIPKEYNASERLNQANGTAPSVTLDLLVDTTENENAVIDISDLTEVDEAITVNRYGGEVAADGTKHTQVGLVATGANETNAALITCAHACYTFELDGTQIYLVALAVQGMNGTDVVSGYASLAEIDENDGATWYILNSDLEGQTVSKSILLDLNGNALTAEISEGVVVSVIDSANDKYDASACGKLTVSGSGTVETIVHTTAKNGGAVKHYVLLKNEDGSYSAHRYVAAVVAVSLDPNNDALGYKASFSADEAARAAVTGYGFNLWVEDGAVKTYTKDSSFVKLGSTLTLRLKNILAAGGGEMTINGNAFINFNIDGQIVSATTSDKSTSMKEVIETVDAAVAEDVNAYTEAQMTAVQNLVNQYESSLTDWSISNIKAWTVPTEDTTGDSTTEDGETTDQGTNA